MSGLSMRSHMNAGQDGFRDKGTKQRCDLREGAIEFVVLPRIGSSSISVQLEPSDRLESTEFSG
jgi:hypothetical protein